MRRTGAGILTIAVVAGLVIGFLLDTVLTAMGRPTFAPAASLPTILALLGAVVVALAIPIYRATRGRSPRRIDPFRAVRIAMLARASSILGAAAAGFAGGLLAFLLSRPVVPSVGSMGSIIATLVCAVVLVVAGLVAEQLCTLRKDDDDDAPGNTPQDPSESEARNVDDADRTVLDDATYDRILEPRSSRRLPLGDGTWHQLARAYVRVQLISQGAVFVLVLAAAVIAQIITGVQWQWIPVGIILLITAVGLFITPRQARSFGYQLRRDDLVFRRGILWQRVVAVPYGRMQLVDITHGPLDRGFGIAQLKLVTAAASTGVTIPGLTQEAAEHLRDTLVAVAETRRTGL